VRQPVRLGKPEEEMRWPEAAGGVRQDCNSMTAPEARSRRIGALVFFALFALWFAWTAWSHHQTTRRRNRPVAAAPAPPRPVAGDLARPAPRPVEETPQPPAPASPETSAGACRERLKNLGLAARIAAARRDGRLPDTLPELARDLVAPGEPVCPGAAAGYVLVTPGADETSPTTVYLECPFHGLALYADGSVAKK
jgi:hypothetical protein